MHGRKPVHGHPCRSVTRLAIRTASLVPSVTVSSLWEANIATLQRHFSPSQVSTLLNSVTKPEALADEAGSATRSSGSPAHQEAPSSSGRPMPSSDRRPPQKRSDPLGDLFGLSDIGSWREFLVVGLGLSDTMFYKLLRFSPGSLLDSSPFEAGKAIMILKGLGYSEVDLLDRVLPVYPELLTLTQEQCDEALALLAPWAEVQCENGSPKPHRSAKGGGEVSVMGLVRQCPSFLIPEVYRPLGIIINRIKISREGK